MWTQTLELLPNLQAQVFLSLFDFREKDGGGGDDTRTSICCCTYLCMYHLLLVCALGLSGGYSNQLSYLARTSLCFSRVNSQLHMWFISPVVNVWAARVYQPFSSETRRCCVIVNKQHTGTKIVWSLFLLTSALSVIIQHRPVICKILGFITRNT